MPSRAVRVGAIAGVVIAGCLDQNPKFIEPTEGAASGGATGTETMGPATGTVGPTTTPPTTTAEPSTTGTTTGATDGETTVDETTGGVTMGPASTTGAPPTCGDGAVDEGEECDDGADNADDAACTKACKYAVCGDGLSWAGMEACDDGNLDPKDGCVACVVPHHCLHAKMLATDPMLVTTGVYWIDPDGTDPMPGLQVKCDMESDGGGWTVIERSPRGMPIGKPLFDPFMINPDKPSGAPYKMAKMAIGAILMKSSAVRIDCGKSDFLQADAIAINAGEMDPPGCDVYVPVSYTGGQVKGVPFSGTLCTGMYGGGQCDGAWNVSDIDQMLCGLFDFPWAEQVTPGSNLFAVDPATQDEQVPQHDCHVANAVREVKLR